MMFKLEFLTSGAAFEDPDGTNTELYRNLEVERILNRICTEVAFGKDSGTIMDFNGNRIGSWSLD